MSKKILIPLIIIIVAALLAAAAYFVIIPRINAGKSNVVDQNTNANTEQTSNQSEGKPVGSGVDSISANGIESSSGSSNYMTFTDEETFVENFILGIFDKSKEESALAVLATNIPSMFDIDSNAINNILRSNGFSTAYSLTSSTEPQINHCSIVSSINNQYDRYVAMVTSNNGTSNETYQMSIVVDLQNHNIVFFNMNKISPVHSELIENEYNYLAARFSGIGDISDDGSGVPDLPSESRLTGDDYIKGSLIALYSYSPFIEEVYWRTVSNNYSFSSSNSNIRSDDVVYRLMLDWRPTLDGSALTVESIGQPAAINSSGNIAYYECPISYRTNHGGNAQDTYTTATLHFYVNLDGMTITSLVEDDVQKTVLDPISAGQTQTPSINALLGIQ